MKITDIRTYLMNGSPANISAGTRGSQKARNWLFVKVFTDEGLYGVGEASGWPRVVETAIKDLTPILIGEDPANIEKIWNKMMVAMMGHGMTGVVGSGAMTGIEMALWDIKGKVLNTPLWNLLGGKLRDKVRIYAHATSAEEANKRLEEGYTALKTGGFRNILDKVAAIRSEVGLEIDLMVDVHGPPWLTTSDAIRLGQKLEKYELLFYEDPVAPEDLEALARVSNAVDIPIAVGERHSNIYGVRELIEREIVDVIQPDTGRAGGLMQMKKIAALAEAHYVTMAPHDGSLGPVAEMAAVHLAATLPNFLILEHIAEDVPQRYDVMDPQPDIVNSHILVPDKPGIGVDISEDVIAKYPSTGNINEPDPEDHYVYFQAMYSRASWLKQ